MGYRDPLVKGLYRSEFYIIMRCDDLKNRFLKALINRKFLVDAVSMGIFWTVVYTPVFLYTSKSLEAALLGLASALVLEIMLGGIYGKFSDWFRFKLGIRPPDE